MMKYLDIFRRLDYKLFIITKPIPIIAKQKKQKVTNINPAKKLAVSLKMWFFEPKK